LHVTLRFGPIFNVAAKLDSVLAEWLDSQLCNLVFTILEPPFSILGSSAGKRIKPPRGS